MGPQFHCFPPQFRLLSPNRYEMVVASPEDMLHPWAVRPGLFPRYSGPTCDGGGVGGGGGGGGGGGDGGGGESNGCL